MVTTGNNAKQQVKVAGNPRVAERSAEVSIRLVPDLAPANLISELNAGLDYYVANVQGAITSEFIAHSSPVVSSLKHFFMWQF